MTSTRKDGRGHWPLPAGGYALLPQVRNGTGYARKQTRTADGIVVSCWPSRGLWIGGIEIKVTKSDFRKEIATPEKAESIARFCKYWWIAAPAGVIPETEVPENWGLIECTRNSANDVRGATALECQPPDMLFLASVLRSASEWCVPIDDVKVREREVAEAAIANGEANAKRRLEELECKIKCFEESSGVSVMEGWNQNSIGEAVRFVRESGVKVALQQAKKFAATARTCAEMFDKAIAKLESGSDA